MLPMYSPFCCLKTSKNIFCVKMVSVETDLAQASAYRSVMASRSSKRSEEHTSELQSLMRISYAVFCLKKKKIQIHTLLCIQHTPIKRNETESDNRSTPSKHHHTRTQRRRPYILQH